MRAATRGFRHISCHLPFQDISLFSSDRAAREAGLERLRGGLNGLAYLNGELAVMHVGWPEKGKRYRDIWTPMVDTLRMLGDYAAERKLRIGIETMQPDSVREYVDLIGAVDHPAVGATIDTGHIRGASDIGLPADRRDTDEARARFDDVLNRLVSTLGNKVIHFHLSDVRRNDWVDHKTIGSGAIDSRRLFETIRSIGYRGLFVLELEEPNQREALQRSKDYVERLMRSGLRDRSLLRDRSAARRRCRRHRVMNVRQAPAFIHFAEDLGLPPPRLARLAIGLRACEFPIEYDPRDVTAPLHGDVTGLEIAPRISLLQKPEERFQLGPRAEALHRIHVRDMRGIRPQVAECLLIAIVDCRHVALDHVFDRRHIVRIA